METIHVSNNDVLCGKGKSHERHDGNVRFQSLIKEECERYREAPSSEKKGIVQRIRSSFERFLDMKGGSGVRKYDESKVHEKIRQALCDSACVVKKNRWHKKKGELLPCTVPTTVSTDISESQSAATHEVTDDELVVSLNVDSEETEKPGNFLEPRECDVVFRRGRYFVNWPGNVFFRKVIQLCTEVIDYFKMELQEKQEAVRLIYQFMLRDHKTHFFSYSVADNKYQLLPERPALTKIGQALRDRYRSKPSAVPASVRISSELSDSLLRFNNDIETFARRMGSESFGDSSRYLLAVSTKDQSLDLPPPDALLAADSAAIDTFADDCHPRPPSLDAGLAVNSTGIDSIADDYHANCFAIDEGDSSFLGNGSAASGEYVHQMLLKPAATDEASEYHRYQDSSSESLDGAGNGFGTEGKYCTSNSDGIESDMRTVLSVASSKAATIISSVDLSMSSSRDDCTAEQASILIFCSQTDNSCAINDGEISEIIGSLRLLSDEQISILDGKTNSVSSSHPNMHCFTGDKLSRSGNTVLSTEPQKQRRRFSGSPGGGSCHTLLSLSLLSLISSSYGSVARLQGWHASNVWNEQLMSSTKSPPSDLEIPLVLPKDISTFSSMPRVMSAPSLLSASNGSRMRLRGELVSNALSNQLVASIAELPSLDIAAAFREGLEIGSSFRHVLTGKEIAMKRRGDDISTAVSGLGYVGGISAKQLLADLGNPSMDVNEIAKLLDDLLELAINEDSQLGSDDFLTDVVNLLCGIMQKHLDSENIQFKSCVFLGNLYANFEYAPVPNHLAKLLINVLQSSHYGNDPRIHQKGWWLIRVLISRDTCIQKTFADTNVIGFLCQKMKEFINIPELQSEGCRLLGQLAYENEANQHSIMEANGLGVILKAMRGHQAHVGVQNMGYYALGQLANASIEKQGAIMEAGVLDAILENMQGHQHHAGVQKEGCFVLGQLANANVENQKGIINGGGLQVILNAMREHQDHADVQKEGCYALGHLWNDNAETQVAIMEADGLDVIWKAMRGHQAHVEFQKEGCSASEQLAFENALALKTNDSAFWGGGHKDIRRINTPYNKPWWIDFDFKCPART